MTVPTKKVISATVTTGSPHKLIELPVHENLSVSVSPPRQLRSNRLPEGCDRMSGNSAFVVMMQPTDFPNFDNFTFVGSLYLSALWGVFAQRQMSAPAMVVGTE